MAKVLGVEAKAKVAVVPVKVAVVLGKVVAGAAQVVAGAAQVAVMAAKVVALTAPVTLRGSNLICQITGCDSAGQEAREKSSPSIKPPDH